MSMDIMIGGGAYSNPMKQIPHPGVIGLDVKPVSAWIWAEMSEGIMAAPGSNSNLIHQKYAAWVMVCWPLM
eukprot:418692-Pelagomonas_calceolata.AAC.7